ncbi:neural cell adhesion molecule L1.1-like isoform X2 [Archocentrus centrarchus]|uniref:neural cell adhesion molecule L1.1-like isoform X2 n=1 Tax=Archocentrus centrarchus TaxID=63155 RepID=UPI0011EA342F|nr:neural cell adhesion molecule L1.1-like isoform X2 [Archocentrus centrarchus]
MCVSQRRWMGCRGLCSPTLPLILLLLLPLSFLSSTPPFAQGAIHIPKTYKQRNILQPPVLTETPKSHTVFSREDLSLTCEATGNPTPTFRWVKDGEVLGSESLGSGTLRADNSSLELLEGYYCCYASNSLGTAMTQTVKLIVEPQPVLLKQQVIRKRASKGQSIVLSCNPPESSTPPSIHWMNMNLMHISRSERVTIGLDGNLYFANLEQSDSKEDYICHAQYKEARTILPATSVSLTVEQSNNVANEEKPRFFHPSVHHSKIMALRGHNVTLECLPKGLPTPKVEWRKKDGILENTTGQVTNFDRWLRFNNITQDDDGEYECKASNIHGFATRSFTVTVEAAPYWVKEPQDLMYTPGETVRLDCQAEGIPKPTITWRINGQLFTEVDEEPRRIVTGGTLIMRDVNTGDTAVYQCEATNVHGSILLNTYLYVVELPPQILTPDWIEYRVTEGGDVALHCESFGSPRPHITWEGEDMAPLLSDPRISLLTNGTIKLSNVGHDDSGVYICSIVNSNISITADLKVFNRTVILSGPQDVRARQGANAFLHCQFYIDPQLQRYQVVWKRHGRKLDESSLDDKYTILENSTLKVTDVQLNDTAQYSCEVITDLDHVNAQSSITVIARPDPPSYLSLSRTEDHSLTLSWTPGPFHNSPITEFIIEAQVEYHTEEMKRKWEELKRVPGNFNHVELSLHPYSTYRFRVIAINEVGQSSPSIASDHHSTPPAAPSSNPTGVRSNSSEPGTLIIIWDEMDKRSHNGKDFEYEVLWREADGSDVNWNSGRVKSPPFIVNNTGTYTPFEVKVKAVNAIGGGPEPEPEIGHSGEDKPEEAPTGVSSTVMNSTVRVRWDKAQKVRGRLRGYRIYVERLGPQEDRTRRSLIKHHHEEDRGRKSEQSRGGEKDSWMVEVDPNKTSEEVTGLRLFSKYELTVTAFNSKGESPHSPPHKFSTPEGAPGPPASLSFESPTEKSLILYWTAPREINGILQGYTVQYQEVESKDTTIKMEPLSDPSVNYLRLDNLDPNSHYIFSVIAHTRAGVGPPITRRGATLLDGVPPSNITVMPGNTSVSLSWVPGVRNRNHGFHIHYLRKSGGSQWEMSEVVNSTQGSYTLMGLQPGADYHLKIMHGNSTQWEGEAKTVESLSVVRGNFTTQGWLIGLISAIMLLVLILLILCLIKRSKGGKYAVKDKESKEVDSEARPMKEETFGEYSDGDEKRSDSQQSLEESKMGSVDSLAEYGDSVDIQFNEDGSFIGQYSGRASAPHGNGSSGPASPVNAVPPPPVAPSMSSILNRPS